MADMKFALIVEANIAKALEGLKQLQDAMKGVEAGKAAENAAKAEAAMKGQAKAANDAAEGIKKAEAAMTGLNKAAAATKIDATLKGAAGSWQAQATAAAKTETSLKAQAKLHKDIAAAVQAGAKAEASFGQSMSASVQGAQKTATAAQEISRATLEAARVQNQMATATKTAADAAIDAARAKAREVEILRRRQAYIASDRAEDRARAARQAPYLDAHTKAIREQIAAGNRTAEATRKAQAAMNGVAQAAKATASAQRDAAAATEKTAEAATRAGGRFRRMGDLARTASRNFARGMGEAVAEAVKDGARRGLAAAREAVVNRIGGGGLGIMSGGGTGYGATGAVARVVGKAFSYAQGAQTSADVMRVQLGEENARRAVQAADAYAAASTFGREETRAAANELSQAGIVANADNLRLLGDAAVNTGSHLADLARTYAAVARSGDIGRIDGMIRGVTTTMGEQESRIVSYLRNAEEVKRTVAAGDKAGAIKALDEMLAAHQGAMARQMATPEGLTAQLGNQAMAFLGKSMEQPVEYVRQKLVEINAAVQALGEGGFDALARKIGGDIVAGLRAVEEGVRGVVGALGEGDTHLASMHSATTGIAADFREIAKSIEWFSWIDQKVRDVHTAVADSGAATNSAVRRGWGFLTGGYSAESARRDAERAAMPPPVEAGAQASATVTQAASTTAAQAPAINLAQAEQASAVLSQVQAKFNEVKAAIEGWSPVGSISAAMSAVQAYLATVSFAEQGARMMDTLAAGMRARASAAVAAVQEVTQQIRDHLPHSPAKVGPLSDLDRIRFSETLAAAIRPEPAVAAVRAMAAGMRAAIPASVAIGMGMGAAGEAAATPAASSVRAALAGARAMAAGMRAAIPSVDPMGIGVTSGGAAPAAVARRSGLGGGPLSISVPLNLTVNGNADQEAFLTALRRHATEVAETVQGVMDRQSQLAFE